MTTVRFVIVSAVTVLVALVLTGCGGERSDGISLPLASTAQPASGWDLPSRHDDAGRVGIDVQPLTLGDDQEIWEFDVALNTHSVDLSYDLAQVAVLRCDRGEEHQPLAWEGSPPGGHHRRGVLRFTSLDHQSSFIDIVIKGVANVPERVFRW